MITPRTKRSLGALPLLYPQPALMVTTYDTNDKPTVMLAAWGGICSSEPPCLYVSVRPKRWTHPGILQHKAFTVGIPSEAMLEAADMTGLVSGRTHDKFAIGNLTVAKTEHVDAPYVVECPVVIECQLLQTVEIGSHTLMIGSIMDVKADEDTLLANGKPDIQKVAPLIFDWGSRAYYGIGKHLGGAYSVGKKILKT